MKCVWQNESEKVELFHLPNIIANGKEIGFPSIDAIISIISEQN